MERFSDWCFTIFGLLTVGLLIAFWAACVTEVMR